MDFIVDRTAEDVALAQSYVGAMWSNMTNAQKQEWLRGKQSGQSLNGLKGFFNATDWVRIKNNFNNLRSYYEITEVDTIDNSYSTGSLVYRTTMAEDFDKIKTVAYSRSCYIPRFLNTSFIDYRTPEKLSTDVNKIDYRFLNNYEHILKNFWDYYNDGYLYLECDYIYNYNTIHTLNSQHTFLPVKLDGTIIGKLGQKFQIYSPEGYILRIFGRTYDWETGTTVTEWTTFVHSGTMYDIYLTSPVNSFTFNVLSGIINDDCLVTQGTDTSISVSRYDKLRLDSDLIIYNYQSTYTATEVQSSMIDVETVKQMYVYDVSSYGDNTIVTLYDENQDIIEEVAIRDNTTINLDDVYYITFDTDVGVSLTYLFASNNYADGFDIYNGSTKIGTYPEMKEVDTTSKNTLKLRYTGNTNTRILVHAERSITNGKDISQLDTNSIEIKYI